jgi:UDPglucose 6-dehydrogenase
MKIAVIGTGYVGLVAGACFAETGNDVVCVDCDEAKLRALRRGKMPIFEPGLEELVRRNRAEKRLVFSRQVAPAVRASSIIFITVGTPLGEDGSVDLQQVLGVAREIAQAMNGYKVIVAKSTVPVGTAGRVREIIRRETTHPFSVVSNPEFLTQGGAVGDFMKPDRVVVGAEDPRATQLMTDLYAPFTRTGAPILVMDCASAEMCKYATNAMLATRISLMNEVARLCEQSGADVNQVRRAVGSDGRIGGDCLFPGIGYGGSSLPSDVRAILKFSSEKDGECQVLAAVERVNRCQPSVLIVKMVKHFGSLAGRTIAVWGLAFKPKTDDMRDAPAIPFIEKLLEAGAKVRAYDPAAMRAAQGIFGSRVTFVKRGYDALVGADGLALVTEWNEFREPDFGKMRKLMQSPVVFDGRNIYNRDQMRADGFTYYAIGR